MSAVMRILQQTRDDDGLIASFILGRPASTQRVYAGEVRTFLRWVNKRGNEPQLTISESHLAQNLQRELENADIPVKTFAGKLDFHALRTTYDSLLFSPRSLDRVR